MIKFLIVLSLFIVLTEGVVIASWGTPSSSSSDYPNSMTGPFADTSSSGDAISLSEFFDRLRGGSRRSYYNYQQPQQYQQPQIYGNTGYTYGQINGMQTYRSGITDYNSYSNSYWSCVNNYRGQFYYSYNMNGYVCDIRGTRNG